MFWHAFFLVPIPFTWYQNMSECNTGKINLFLFQYGKLAIINSKYNSKIQLATTIPKMLKTKF